MGPPDLESPRKNAHDHTRNIHIGLYPICHENAPIYPRAHITTLQPIAIAEKIAMQFMAIASLHYDFPTGTPQ
jgi:hypothetical protein